MSTGLIVFLVILGLGALFELAELVWGIGELFADIVDWLCERRERRRSRQRTQPGR